MISIEQINRDKTWFLGHCTDIIDKKLNSVGLQTLEIDVIDITDNSGFIEKMQAQAKADYHKSHEDAENLGEQDTTSASIESIS